MLVSISVDLRSVADTIHPQMSQMFADRATDALIISLADPVTGTFESVRAID